MAAPQTSNGPVQPDRLSFAWSLAEKSTPITLMLILLVGAIMYRNLTGQVSRSLDVSQKLFAQLIEAKDIQIKQSREYAENLVKLSHNCLPASKDN